jgi:hypothetical protein
MTKIVFAKQKSKLMFLSKVIEKVENLPVSHCAIVCDGVVFESTWPKSKICPLVEWLEQYEIVFSFDARENLSEIRGWFFRNCLKPYSLKQLFVMALTYVSAPLKLAFEKMQWNGSKALVCTEVVGMFLTDFYGYDFKESPDTISVRDALDACKEVLK